MDAKELAGLFSLIPHISASVNTQTQSISLSLKWDWGTAGECSLDQKTGFEFEHQLSLESWRDLSRNEDEKEL